MGFFLSVSNFPYFDAITRLILTSFLLNFVIVPLHCRAILPSFEVSNTAILPFVSHVVKLLKLISPARHPLGIVLLTISEYVNIKCVGGIYSGPL